MHLSPVFAIEICPALVKEAQPFAAGVDSLPETLKVASFNTFNLRASAGPRPPDSEQGRLKSWYYRRSQEKPEEKLLEMAQSIARIDPDILLLQEVEVFQAAIEFNNRYLNQEYRILYVAGQARRTNALAFLVRKDLFETFEFTVKPPLKLLWTDPTMPHKGETPLFSREPIVVEMRRRDLEPNSAPDLIFVGVHLKSKRDRPQDPNSKIWRGRQAQGLVSTIQKLKIEYGKDLPIVEMGDHNASFLFEREFEPFFRVAHLTDTMDLIEDAPTRDKRVTHTYHTPPLHRDRYQQLDGILVTPSLAVARSKSERKEQPSDHRPVWALLDLWDILRKRSN
jgi:endonuclease/exonuclease/phosphatase family metal-dependent hydrolase